MKFPRVLSSLFFVVAPPSLGAGGGYLASGALSQSIGATLIIAAIAAGAFLICLGLNVVYDVAKTDAAERLADDLQG